MKKIIFILLLLISITGKSFASDNTICISLDWQLSVRGGIEHQFNHRLGIKSDIGISFLGLLCADALLVVYLLPEKCRWELNACAGIPSAITLITFESGLLSFGGGLLTRFKINDKVGLDFTVSEGFPLFFEKDKDIVSDNNFPLNLWPNFVLGVSIKI